MNPLYIASKNKHKTEELKAMLASQDFEVHDLNDFAEYISPEETGTTFVENAKIKAQALQNFLVKKGITNAYILADDSGLECDDLGGAPGVYSARFAGENATDQDNNKKLITDIQKLPHPTRQARYVCALAFLSPQNESKEIIGTCEGHIVFEPKGQHGFGYDPYFYVPEFEKTMAELSPETKNQISHRAQALQKLLRTLP